MNYFCHVHHKTSRDDDLNLRSRVAARRFTEVNIGPMRKHKRHTAQGQWRLDNLYMSGQKTLTNPFTPKI